MHHLAHIIVVKMLNSLPVASYKCILCYYTNETSQIRILFEAPEEALMEIYTYMMATAVLSRLHCKRLQVDYNDRP